jgi:mannose-6-phosphate isomerase-like protein (cupin superfamily)
MDRRQSILGLFALAASASAKGTPKPVPDSLTSFDTAKTQKHPFGELTVFCEGKTGQLQSLVVGTLLLYPGQEPHPPHQHPEEEIMIMTEGEGMILVGGKNAPVSVGTVMYVEGNHLHGVKNTSSKPLRFYYMKWVA